MSSHAAVSQACVQAQPEPVLFRALPAGALQRSSCVLFVCAHTMWCNTQPCNTVGLFNSARTECRVTGMCLTWHTSKEPGSMYHGKSRSVWEMSESDAVWHNDGFLQRCVF